MYIKLASVKPKSIFWAVFFGRVCFKCLEWCFIEDLHYVTLYINYH